MDHHVDSELSNLPGERMPPGAPIRRRSAHYDALVAVYYERFARAASEPSGARRTKAEARARSVLLSRPASTRTKRKRGLSKEPAMAPLRKHQIKTLLEVQRYAMLEAKANFERVAGAMAVAS